MRPKTNDHADHDDDPPETLHEPAQPHHDTGGKRQRNAQAGKQVGEDGNHPLEQGGDDQARQADDGDGIDQRRFHGGLQANRLFHVDGQTLQNDVENTAGFTRLDHVGGEVIEDHRELPHGIGQRRAAFYGGADAGQRLLEGWVFLVGRQDFQTLHQRQAGIDHDRELAKENRDVLDLDLARSESGHGKFFALFPDSTRRYALAPQCLLQSLFVWCYALSGDFLSGGVLAGKCENWHGLGLSSVSSLIPEFPAAQTCCALLIASAACAMRRPIFYFEAAPLAAVPVPPRFNKLAPRLIISCSSS